MLTNVILMAQLNVLSEWPVKDTITVSVLQIVEHLMMLGFEKQVYFGMVNRVFPQNKNISSASAAATVLNQFFNCVLDILTRADSEVRKR